jgi:hypothetical protein
LEWYFNICIYLHFAFWHDLLYLCFIHIQYFVW